MKDIRSDYEVVVVGAGPVGLVLAVDLGRRGVRTLLVEKDRDTKAWPKMDRSNARTMEMFRRLGLAEQVRALGYPADASMDVFIVSTLDRPPLAVLRYPTVAEFRESIRTAHDGSRPLEPYQLVSQNDLEPLLRRTAEALPTVTVRFGCELVDFEQSADGVSADMRYLDGTTGTVGCHYLVGCDGGVSVVRKTLGIPLNGRGRLAQQLQVTFRSDDLYERIPVGQGRHYYFADEPRAAMVVQGSRRQFTLNLRPAEEEYDLEAEIRNRIGADIDFEVVNSRRWNMHLLLADRYRDGRVFIAGDAAHLVIPTGGLGMNTGVGDAIDLGWKLAGTVQGWGGPGLVDSYEVERRKVGARNVAASGWAAEGMFLWQSLWRPDLHDDTPEGAEARQVLVTAALQHHRRVYEMVGVELGYTYSGSDLVVDDIETENTENTVNTADILTYTPSARPGARIPHVWLSDGRALQDVVGSDYTLVDLAGDTDTSEVEAAFHRVGAPLEVVRCDEPQARAVYGAPLLLLRPDLHVFWRGDRLPQPDLLVRAATGFIPGRLLAGQAAGATR